MNRSPRVAHVIHSGAIGGGPRVVLAIAQNVAAHHLIAAPEDGPLLDDARALGLETVALSHAGKYSFPAATKQMAHAFRHATIVHVHGQYAGFYAGGVARATRVPVLYTAHFPSFVTDAGPRTKIRNFLVEKATCAAANHVVACSEAMRREFIARRLTPSSHITTIYNGVSEQVAGPGIDALRAEMGLLPQDRVLVAMGRLTEQKGFDILLQAMPEIQGQVPGTTLLVVGDGEQRDRLEQQARHLSIQGSVRFTGFQRNTADFLHLADVVVVPSRYDIFPLVPLEAMMAGRAVVASDLPVLREAVDHETTGLLVRLTPRALASAIVDLLRDSERRARMARAAREQAKARFSLGRMAARYAEMYATLGTESA